MGQKLGIEVGGSIQLSDGSFVLNINGSLYLRGVDGRQFQLPDDFSLEDYQDGHWRGDGHHHDWGHDRDWNNDDDWHFEPEEVPNGSDGNAWLRIQEATEERISQIEENAERIKVENAWGDISNLLSSFGRNCERGGAGTFSGGVCYEEPHPQTFEQWLQKEHPTHMENYGLVAPYIDNGDGPQGDASKYIPDLGAAGVKVADAGATNDSLPKQLINNKNLIG